MASGGGVKDQFSKFATKASGTEATSKDMTRWCQDAGVFGKNCTSTNMDIAFSKVKTKGKHTITIGQLDALIDEIAKAYMKDKSCSIDEAKQQLRDKMAATEPKAHGTTKTSKTGGVAKMTDTSLYTGSHKARFDEDGKGRGIEGREDTTENSGYVFNYKDKDTWDERH